ncbi:MAG: CoA transferase [Acidimicrobiaceae bacterium]|nr:CoA transferase [Acidimicrobiaceae bacterium]
MTAGLPERKGPLSDLHVVEFGGYGAGPAVGKSLAEHGAEVIRVESMLRLDGFRTNYPPYTGNVPGIERAAMFAITNDNKLDVSLNLKTEKGKDLAVRLIERADVVVENFTPGAMDRLGLGHEAMVLRNSKLVTLSTCNQGRTGPQANRAGFGSHLTSLSGFTELTGWPDRQPALLWGPYIDYIAVAYGVVAVLAALEQVRRTEVGCHIDLSQYETGVQFMAPALVRYFANGEEMDRNGNRDPNAVPHGVFPCAGEQRWCAISVHDDAEWNRFVLEVGEPWAKEPEFSTAAGRRDNEDQLEELITGWTENQLREAVVERMRKAGVHSAPVNDMGDLYSDPQLTYRNAFQRVDHAHMGEHAVPAPPYILPASPGKVTHAAPTVGQHNEAVLCGILGLSKLEFEDLQLSEVLK